MISLGMFHRLNFTAVTLGLAALAATGSVLHLRAQSAQPAPAAAPQFEAASIKPGDPASPGTQMMITPGGRFGAKNASLRALIRYAYDVRDNQISGGPNWLDSAKWDIEAKPEAPVNAGPGNDNPLRRMVQSLLAERFKLALHRERKEQQVYALVIAKGGPKFKETEGNTGPGGGGRGKGMTRFSRGALNGNGTTMEMLAQLLSNTLGRSVLDKTGLTGGYDIKLEWTPDESEMMMKGPDGGAAAPTPPDSSGPSLFSALQEQLGLKLESTKGPVEILVIDRAEKASEN